MRNAKQELLEAVKESKQNIVCAEIIYYGTTDYDHYVNEEDKQHITLNANHTEEEYHKFLNELNFEYYSGYGGQELFGTVWLSNNTWLERGEYDGSEWWEFKECPTIPDSLKGE